jgi:hypothetical protein
VYYNKIIGQERRRGRRKKATCWAVKYFENREKRVRRKMDQCEENKSRWGKI